MDMKTIYNNVTGWSGWLFCEISFKIFDLSEVGWLWSDKYDEFVWWFRPVGWIANVAYNIGCWFYNLEKD